MTFPQELTYRLLEFMLDNHTTILVCATSVQDDVRCEERQSLRTGIEDILTDALENPSMKDPPPLEATAAVAEATEAVWAFVLGSFDDNVWLDNEERIVFFARWETALKNDVKNLLTRLTEDL
ncbi:hypothetical protein LCGC14_0906990 [marine sediment metagenome]|uniref:Uncharacterized protein n=1 Tax=marine sediment metagenome TaxID=412755 RepID=A0A0F9NZG1_9ZZZZ